MNLAATHAQELPFQEYQLRQYRECERPALESRLGQLRPGGRGRFAEGRWSPLPYPGFAMQAMVAESGLNRNLALQLEALQQQLSDLLPRPGALYPLPASSFHQTVANTFSADRLVDHVIDKGLHAAFPGIVARRIRTLDTPIAPETLCMRLIGVSLFRTAIGALGVFESEEDFQRVIGFRDRFYGDEELAQIGLRRTRPFIGHITLAYFEDELSPEEKRSLLAGVESINGELRAAPLSFDMPRARLHRYDDLSRFIAEPDYPVANL